jgi:thioredoxin-like negative regulator of GroEL
MLAQAAEIDPRNEAVSWIARRFWSTRRLEQAVIARCAHPSRRWRSRGKPESAPGFAASAVSSPDATELARRIGVNENDLDARLQLANLRVSNREYAGALEQLLEIVRRDRKFEDDIARKTMLQVFGLLGPTHELTGEYRRRLASTMY